MADTKTYPVIKAEDVHRNNMDFGWLHGNISTNEVPLLYFYCAYTGTKVWFHGRAFAKPPQQSFTELGGAR